MKTAGNSFPAVIFVMGYAFVMRSVPHMISSPLC